SGVPERQCRPQRRGLRISPKRIFAQMFLKHSCGFRTLLIAWPIPRNPQCMCSPALRRTSLRQVMAHQPLEGVRPMPQLLSRSGRWSVLVAAAALVAACSESTTNPSRNLSPSVANADQWPEFNAPNADKRVMHVRGWYDNNGNANGLDNGNA